MSQDINSNSYRTPKPHSDGWGAIWTDTSAPNKLLVHRDLRPIQECLDDSPLSSVITDFLVIHVRRATLSHQQGIQYTHPITSEDTTVPWFLMHNGFLPTVCYELGMESSAFDSSEFLKYIIPREGNMLDRNEVINKLEHLRPGSISANSIIINPQRSYVLQWFPQQTSDPAYFTMNLLRSTEVTYIASEIIPSLAPAARWSPLKNGELLEFPLQNRP